MDDSLKDLTKAAWSVGSHNESRAEAMTASRLREQCRLTAGRPAGALAAAACLSLVSSK